MRTTCQLVVAGVLAGCATLSQQMKPGDRPPGMAGAASASQVPREVPVAIAPLPGGLDATPVFNSNSPEVVTEAGITLSTLPGRNPAVHQGVAFSGAFTVFSHHIAKDATPGERLLRLGLVAHNPGARPVTLRLLAGASYLSQPEALFKPLEPLIPDPEGVVYAGPGDRVATELLHGRSPIAATSWTIPPKGDVLVYDLPVPTDVAIPPPVNGRSTLLRLEAQGPVHLAEAAVFAARSATGGFSPTTLADFQRALAADRLAGPRDLAATPFDPDGPPPAGFRYGRVAGVSVGDRWRAAIGDRLAGLAPGDRAGVPIAAVYLNRLGTGQNQSAPMKSRYPDTAFQAHGNYGVTYELTLDLPNPDSAPRSYALSLSHPARVVGDLARPAAGPPRAAVYMDPPGKPVMFRGPVRVEVDGQLAFTHLTIRHGEELPPFARVSVPAGETKRAKVGLIYPADATPPQLLTIARE